MSYTNLEKILINLEALSGKSTKLQKSVIEANGASEEPVIEAINPLIICLFDLAATNHKLKQYLNEIDEKGAEALAGNTTLTNLNVSCNKISNKGAKAFAGNITLTMLDVNGENIKKESLNLIATRIQKNIDIAFKQAYPMGFFQQNTSIENGIHKNTFGVGFTFE